MNEETQDKESLPDTTHRAEDEVSDGTGSETKHEDPEALKQTYHDNDMEEFQDQDKNRNLAQLIRLAVCAIAFVVGFAICFVEIGGDRKINQTMAIAIWMASLWLTELIPLVVTAFFPLVLFPFFGIISGKVIAAKYINDTIFLFISGFMMALTLERWNIHRRFSLKILSLCGTSPSRLLLGMMGATFILSSTFSSCFSISCFFRVCFTHCSFILFLDPLQCSSRILLQAS